MCVYNFSCSIYNVIIILTCGFLWLCWYAVIKQFVGSFPEVSPEVSLKLKVALTDIRISWLLSTMLDSAAGCLVHDWCSVFITIPADDPSALTRHYLSPTAWTTNWGQEDGAPQEPHHQQKAQVHSLPLLYSQKAQLDCSHANPHRGKALLVSSLSLSL